MEHVGYTPISITFIPSYMRALHVDIIGGDAHTYKEIGDRFCAVLTPTPTQRMLFPNLTDAEEVWAVYKRRR